MESERRSTLLFARRIRLESGPTGRSDVLEIADGGAIEEGRGREDGWQSQGGADRLEGIEQGRVGLLPPVLRGHQRHDAAGRRVDAIEPQAVERLTAGESGERRGEADAGPGPDEADSHLETAALRNHAMPGQHFVVPVLDALGVLGAEDELDRTVEDGGIIGAQFTRWIGNAVQMQPLGDDEHIRILNDRHLHEADTRLGRGIGGQQADTDAPAIEHFEHVGGGAFLNIEIDLGKFPPAYD